jgi:hypothetical protein
MSKMLRATALSISVLALPAFAFAQSNPQGNLGSNNSVTATPRTANSPASTLHSGDATALPPAINPAAQNPNVPGATGRTVVPGTNSTVSGDRPATANSKTSGATNGR